ncbi:class I SAM-dependent methyltransferase [Prosthecomicrobium hirschii]|uniref:class I SAM-dependent methyltransferase n=1 Tax=Prosthecodimorpha hirschii TaxID=665126 RepID=UPI00221F66A6|nr:class I SAM-dependent methyltransferase [Prosthecomicrobium hirschii]MCW1843995.1 class I SAM-dependent methyltransferase [Prosthecomicrobium hirschii]
MVGVQPLSDTAVGRVQDFYRVQGGREAWPWRHWNAQPTVARAINRRISGSPRRSLHEVLGEVLPDLGLSLPAARAVSLGCGRGGQDRSLFRHGIVKTLVGYDLSPDSIEAAAGWARAAGIEGFHYRLGDLNSLDLDEGAYDLVVATMSLHHAAELERLYDVAARALRPGGLMVIDEYAGPSRFRWTEAQMRAVNGLLTILSPAMRTTPDGILKPLIEHQPEAFFEAVDPSEAIRSGEVLACLEARFDVLWRRPYGGTILHPMLHDIACNFREGDLFAETFLGAAIALEDTMMATGELQSDFVALVARPK